MPKKLSASPSRTGAVLLSTETDPWFQEQSWSHYRQKQKKKKFNFL